MTGWYDIPDYADPCRARPGRAAPAVRERPIIFGPDMVRAILAGTKSQTRRVIRDGRILIRTGVVAPAERLYRSEEVAHLCPHGQPGDRLWVREGLIRGGMPDFWTGIPNPEIPIATYLADGATVIEENGFDVVPWWRGERLPSIHMPRWASRLTLEITAVRVERVRDITEADALAEGGWTYATCPIHKSPEASFAQLWDSINAGRGFGWQANPWVWVLEFRRIEQERTVAA